MVRYRWLWLIPGIVVLDQILKYVVRMVSPDFYVSRWFSFTYIKNTGAGFGLLSGHNYLVLLVNVVALVLLYLLFSRDEKSLFADISLVLIMAGAIGNMLDRVVLGFVTDFIYFHFWPAFNVADISISVGGVLLAYCLLSRKYDVVGEKR